MIAEAVTIDGSFLMSGGTIIAIILGSWKISSVVTKFTTKQDDSIKAIQDTRDKVVLLEKEHRDHRHEDNTKHHSSDKRLDRVEHALASLGVPTMMIHQDVTPIVTEPLPAWRTHTPRPKTGPQAPIDSDEG